MKKLLIILLTIYICIFSCFAYSTTPYQGTFSSSLLQVLRDIAENVSPLPYVAWRDSEDDYCIFYSDTLECNGTTFASGEGTCITISSVARTQYINSYIDFYKRNMDSLELSTNNVLVYSNLPGFPTLSEKEVIYFDTFFLFAFIIIIVLIFNRLMRSRSRRWRVFFWR